MCSLLPRSKACVGSERRTCSSRRGAPRSDGVAADMNTHGTSASDSVIDAVDKFDNQSGRLIERLVFNNRRWILIWGGVVFLVTTQDGRRRRGGASLHRRRPRPA